MGISSELEAELQAHIVSEEVVVVQHSGRRASVAPKAEAKAQAKANAKTAKPKSNKNR